MSTGGRKPDEHRGKEEPYVITKEVNDVVVKIQRNRRTKPRIVHVDRLKLVEGAVDTSWFGGEEPSRRESQQMSQAVATEEGELPC